MIRTRDHRKAIPAGVKVQCLMVALAEALGLPSDTRFEFDHDPALTLREFDSIAGDFIPPQNDPAFIVVRTEADHDRKTFGTKATTAGSDIHARTHVNRLSKDQQEFRSRMLTKQPGEPRQRSGKIPTRPFPEGRKFERRTP